MHNNFSILDSLMSIKRSCVIVRLKKVKLLSSYVMRLKLKKKKEKKMNERGVENKKKHLISS
jgi:hypothetical protein